MNPSRSICHRCGRPCDKFCSVPCHAAVLRRRLCLRCAGRLPLFPASSVRSVIFPAKQHAYTHTTLYEVFRRACQCSRSRKLYIMRGGQSRVSQVTTAPWTFSAVLDRQSPNMFTQSFLHSVIAAVLLSSCTAAPAGSSQGSDLSPATNVLSRTALPASSSVATVVHSSTQAISTPASILSVLPSSAASDAHSSSKPSGTESAIVATATVPYADDNANGVMWNSSYSGVPQAVRGTLGASVLGPQDVGLSKENPDLLAPPTTDAGTVYVIYSWQFSPYSDLSLEEMQNGHSALVTTAYRRVAGLVSRMVSIACKFTRGVLTRVFTVDVLPMATEMAGVNMRLEVGAIR